MPAPPGPAPGDKNIVELAVATPDRSTLVTALKAADLVDILTGKGPFTVFAPTTEAFAALPRGALAKLLDAAARGNKGPLKALLEYHVVAGKAIKSGGLTKGSTTVATTVEGDKVGLLRARTPKGHLPAYFLNKIEGTTCSGFRYRECYEAKVTTANALASNGVVHIVDGVLSIPK